ncbi:MAG: energy-coupling factor transporter transmembrane protein EcfT [Desulfuromonadaceae bacterium]|nr:energy-coupling factor transporter transmembrane protein EcfT [Desulfuromonadaceae bacterium]MDD2854593.1 energy-coupling factor transporter transmembrane protein EcfT [Desulfuromonadaceae bacterium]
MLKILSNGRYIPGSSLLHRSDPRTKLLMSLFFVTGAMFFQNYLPLTLMLIFTLLIAQTTGRSLNCLLNGLRPIAYLAVITMIAHLFFTSDTPLAENGLLSFISKDGIERSLKMVLRLAIMISSTSLLTGTTTPLALMDGLQWMTRPLRRIGLPVGEITTMLSIALRFIPTIAEETELLIKKNPVFKNGGLTERAKGCVGLLIPLFDGVVRRGDKLATAMEARCFGACESRTRMQPLKFSSTDVTSSLIILVFLAILSYVEYTYRQ